MAVLDRLVGSPKSQLADTLSRGRARHRQWLPGWAEQMAFWQGRQFVWRNRSGTLSELRTENDAKEEYRSRLVRNRIFKIVNAEVSAGTTRPPSYDVVPSKAEEPAIGAAKLGSKVLLHLHDFLRLRPKLVNAYRYAVVNGEGYVRPYWNPTVGKPLSRMDEDDPEEKQLFEGEIAVEVLGPDQVFWEPGLSFDESPWHAIDTVMPPDRVAQLPGLKVDPKQLKADQSSHVSFVTGQLGKQARRGDSILVTEFLERPKLGGRGVRVFLAGDREITERDPYPACVNGPNGPEPCLLQLNYVETPDRDRNMGLVEHLVDPQRTANDCINKQVEWKNAALMPQVLTGPGGMIEPLTNEPFAVFRVKGDVGKVKFRETPNLPPELQQMLEQSYQDMEEIAAQRSVPSQGESGRAIAAIMEQDDSVRGHIVQNLADFYGRLGAPLLVLVQDHYTEQRLRTVNSTYSYDHISFKGADLRGEIDVRVLPASIEPVTRQAVERRVMQYASLGWVTKEQAISAIENGTAEGLVRSFQEDIGRVTRIIERIKKSPEAFLRDRTGPADPDGVQRPDWMPRSFDNVDVQMQALEEWLKSADYDYLPADAQTAANLYYEGLQWEKTRREQMAAQAQAMQAQSLGMENASQPQLPKSLPDRPGLELKSPDIAQDVPQPA